MPRKCLKISSKSKPAHYDKGIICTSCGWIAPELNKDYAQWVEHNHTLILSVKIKCAVARFKQNRQRNAIREAMFLPI